MNRVSNFQPPPPPPVFQQQQTYEQPTAPPPPELLPNIPELPAASLWLPDARLETIQSTTKFILTQDINMDNPLTGMTVGVRYAIRNSNNEQLFLATQSNSLSIFNILNSANQEVLRITKVNSTCNGCCFPSCCCGGSGEEIRVESPPGVLIGVVKQISGCCSMKYEILDETNGLVASIALDKSTLEYKITSTQTVATAQIGATSPDGISLANICNLSFLDSFLTSTVKAKACVLAAVFLIGEWFEDEESCCDSLECECGKHSGGGGGHTFSKHKKRHNNFHHSSGFHHHGFGHHHHHGIGHYGMGHHGIGHHGIGHNGIGHHGFHGTSFGRSHFGHKSSGFGRSSGFGKSSGFGGRKGGRR